MAVTMEQALRVNEFHQDGGPSGRPCESKKGPVRWRRNGKTQVWMRKPEQFSVPVKWGMYSYSRIDGTNQHLVHALEDCPVEKAKGHDPSVKLAVAEAIEHGHPEWSHLMAYGPCKKPSNFDKISFNR